MRHPYDSVTLGASKVISPQRGSSRGRERSHK